MWRPCSKHNSKLLISEKVSGNRFHSWQEENTQTRRDSWEKLDEISARLKTVPKTVQRMGVSASSVRNATKVLQLPRHNTTVAHKLRRKSRSKTEFYEVVPSLVCMPEKDSQRLFSLAIKLVSISVATWALGIEHWSVEYPTDIQNEPLPWRRCWCVVVCNGHWIIGPVFRKTVSSHRYVIRILTLFHHLSDY
jgi:hypothetical protein